MGYAGAKLTPLGRYWLEHRECPPTGAIFEPLLDLDEPESKAAGGALSDAEFVSRRRVLKSDWTARGSVMSRPDLSDQWTLHAAFQPSKETLTDADALNDYRGLARHDAEQVSEAASAWERYQRVHELMLQQAALTAPGKDTNTTPPRRKRKDRPLSVRALARPEPDLGRLAQLVVHLAVQAAKERADDPDMPAEERQRSRTSSTLLSRLEDHQPVKVVPPRKDRKNRVKRPSQPAPRTMPTAIAAKLNEASACHDAGSHLAAVLVVRSAVADVLQDFGEPASSDDLASMLTGLVDQRRLSQQTAALVGVQRCLTVVPTHPPVTPDEVQGPAARGGPGRHHRLHDGVPAEGGHVAVAGGRREADNCVAAADVAGEAGAQPQLLQHLPVAACAGAGQGADLRENGCHALRHFFASTALHEGETIKAVSEYLGHADPGFTLRTYTHLMEGSSERTKRAIDAVCLGKPDADDEPDEDEEDGEDPEY